MAQFNYSKAARRCEILRNLGEVIGLSSHWGTWEFEIKENTKYIVMTDADFEWILLMLSKMVKTAMQYDIEKDREFVKIYNEKIRVGGETIQIGRPVLNL